MGLSLKAGKARLTEINHIPITIFEKIGSFYFALIFLRQVGEVSILQLRDAGVGD